ncbi:MAG TPA: class I SAM-dependent methyltransferase, partial [Ferruginibacter sp.]|nr:class I SAM-dependent methyltransferase [Ferruginibacter sp.]
MSEFWNARYSQAEYVYGETPNVFFAAQLYKLTAGTIILPCEGEGRNAVYAASQGWDVKAFDTSEEGEKKALLLAGKKNVLFEYTVEDALAISYPAYSADSVAFIFAHFPPDMRTLIHQKAIDWLKPGGTLI